MEREQKLLAQALDAGLMKSPNKELLSLGHNVLAHDSKAGLAFLGALHELAEAGSDELRDALFLATLVAGEEGEKLAVEELSSPIEARRKLWARYLAFGAIYRSSASRIHEVLKLEQPDEVAAFLLDALAMIGDPDSTRVVGEIMRQSTADAVQARAIFAYAELGGFDVLGELGDVKAVGPDAAHEKSEAIEWLRTNTRADSKHGHEVGNSDEFVVRFGDLYSCPTVKFLADQGLLAENVVKIPVRLSATQKSRLMELLVDSKGFGLEAVKGSLFLSLSSGDESVLLRIRALGFVSPNEYSMSRLNTIGILVRKIRLDL